ncbi:MAG: mechanosensitive ion channel [Legionellaceae bacterium]|nr:mechanosensitive ion channel [Legionellaceae bacterium]
MSKKQSFFLFLRSGLVGLFLIWSTPITALQGSTSGKLIEYLAAEKVNLTVTNSNLRSFSIPITRDTINEQKARVATQQTLITAKIETLNGFLVSQEKKQHDLKLRLKQFKQSSVTPSEALVLQESVNQVRAFIQVNEKAIELIEANLTLAYQYQKTLYKREHQLILWEAAEEKNHIVQLKQNMLTALDQKRTALYEENIKIEQQKKSGLRAEAKGVGDEVALLLNNQEILLIDHQAVLAQWEITLAEADYVFLEKNKEVKSLESILDVYMGAATQLDVMSDALTYMQKTLKTESSILSNEADKQGMRALEAKLKAFDQQLNELKKMVSDVLKEKQAVLKKQRASRQTFDDYKQASLSGLMHQMGQVPFQLYQYLQTLFVKALDHYLWEDIWPQILFWSVLFLITVFFTATRRLLRPVTQEKARSRFSGHLYDGALLLFYRNLPQFLIVTLLITSLLLNQVMFTHLLLLFHLCLIWLVYRHLIGIARLVLLERVSDVPKHEMALYRRFKWLFFIGAWATALMSLGQELPLSFLLQDVFNRLFMLFLFAIAWVLWQSREIFPELFHTWLHSNKRPFRHLLSFLSFLIPIILLTTVIIGLLGYIHFAWILARYQAYFVLILIAYVILRELLSDFLDLLSEKMVSKLHNGWLWVEALVKPLEKWLHFGLLFLSVLIIFRGFKNNWELTMVSSVRTIGTYPIFSGTEVHITLFSVIEATIVLLILIWLAKWTREFCYRWLYRKVIDAAIRNSVSIFTQYTVILFGSFIFLRVLGVDLTGMGMVLGGLAVGMGFGLRDFASNIVGGLMLLIERPVREGDVITLGEYEGRVEHIGIRSMRISSWDKMDVLIPNAETFNKPVTNWTHQDGVVRTVLPVKVNRSDDPALVKQLIFDVLDIIPGVLKEPPFQVFLKHIDEALIEFEVRYFINVKLHLRVAVRSEVLLAIMAQFKAAGIQAPIPPLRVEVETNHRTGHEPNITPDQ